MQLVSYNIQFGRGKDGRVDLPRIAAEIDSADVIALQEVDRFWARSDMTDQVAALSALLPDRHVAYGPGVDEDGSLADSSGRVLRRRRQFGNLLLSRHPILAVRNHLLPKLNLLDQLSLQRSALECVIACPNGPARIYSVHLGHVSSAERLRQTQRLRAIHREAREDGGVRSGPSPAWDRQAPPPPTADGAILLGDFNMEPETPEYIELTGLADARKYGRVTAMDGFVDAWERAGQGGSGATKFDPGGQRRIDYAFVSAGLAPRIRGVRVDNAAEGSDHQPLWLEIDL
ncbi:MAG: endonuclease/exonuclease/phosphatase family protein [Alphaproteobacteria bacterium]